MTTSPTSPTRTITASTNSISGPSGSRQLARELGGVDGTERALTRGSSGPQRDQRAEHRYQAADPDPRNERRDDHAEVRRRRIVRVALGDRRDQLRLVA